jgi:hypothetical protein
MYKPGNVSRPPPILVPHQPRLDWQMWFAALGPHTHSPWFTSLVFRLLQGKEPGEGQAGGGLRKGICRIQGHAESPPLYSDPPGSESCRQLPISQAAAYLHPGPALQVLVLTAWGEGVRPGLQVGCWGLGSGHALNIQFYCGRWWHRQWVEEFFPPVSLGDPKLEMLLRQFGLQVGGYQPVWGRWQGEPSTGASPESLLQSCPHRTRVHPGPTAPEEPWPRPSTGCGHSYLPWSLPPCSGDFWGLWELSELCRP